MAKTLFEIAYRTGGTENCQWHPVIGAFTRGECEFAQKAKQKIADLEIEVYELRLRLGNAERRLSDVGYRRCTSPACNCYGYHRYGPNVSQSRA